MLYTGITGKVKLGEKLIAHIANFSLETTSEIQEVISFGNKFKEKVPSILDWTADVDGAADFAKDSGQKELWDAMNNQTLLTFGFYLNDATYMEGSGYIESLSIDNAADGNAEVSASISGSGSLELTVPTE